MKTTEAERVEVTIRIPKIVFDFLKASTEDIEEYLMYSIITVVYADLDNGKVFPNPREALARFDLFPVFKRYGVPS